MQIETADARLWSEIDSDEQEYLDLLFTYGDGYVAFDRLSEHTESSNQTENSSTSLA